MGAQDQIEQIADDINDLAGGKKIREGMESGMSNYLPEGYLTQYEYEKYRAAISNNELVNAQTIIDRLGPEEEIGFRYENLIIIHRDHCEALS